MSNPFNWIEIPVNDIPRAKKFYEAMLGIEMEVHNMDPVEMAWFPGMVNDKYGATGSLVKGPGYTPSQEGTLVYFSVEDIQAMLAKIEKAGGKTVMPKFGIGEYGFIAQFTDTEGNRLALHSMT